MHKTLRYPAVPLIVHDPFFSIWSFSETLNSSWQRHWTGHPCDFTGLLKIDGKPYCFLSFPGREIPRLTQMSIEVLPTRTIAVFQDNGIRLTVTFLTPALLNDLDVLSRPATYLIFSLENLDKKKHEVSLYFDATALAAVDNNAELVNWGRFALPGLSALCLGSVAQNMLETCGDDHRINWGRLCLAVPEDIPCGLRENPCSRQLFLEQDQIGSSDFMDMPRPASRIVACLMKKMVLSGEQTQHFHCILAYDDLYAIEYLHTRLKAWWKRDDESFDGMLCKAEQGFPALEKRCVQWDKMITSAAKKAGGKSYAEVCSLLYRQAIGAHKLVASPDGKPWFFSKENFSNGCIATVDVTYPSSPLFLLYAPELLRGMLEPVFRYAASGRWKFPFAPHDLGTYPLANGQVYGGGEKSPKRQMPVEECGNLLILSAALLHFASESEFVSEHFPLLKKWAEYLEKEGADPAEQLCTDDFAGHLAHNANLAVKAILALGAFAQICGKLKYPDLQKHFRKTATRFAKQWMAATRSNGPQTCLAFGKLDSWSQKYNLVWDRLLGLNLFPDDLFGSELAFYKTKMERYGIPLDSRKSYTKLDWLFWTATFAENKKDFETLIRPAALWLDETEARVPVTDWYDCITGEQQGFQARSVVGGVFLRLLQISAEKKHWQCSDRHNR